LCDERHAFGRRVGVDGPDEDAFRDGVGDVPEDAENLMLLAFSI